MTLLGLLLAGFVEGTAAHAPLQCTFAEDDSALQSIVIEVAPAEGFVLKDGLHSVEMTLNDKIVLPATAGAISTTPHRDVLIRGRTQDQVFFTVGVNDEGYAALNMLWTPDKADAARQRTWTGHCRNHKDHINRWLTF